MVTNTAHDGDVLDALMAALTNRFGRHLGSIIGLDEADEVIADLNASGYTITRTAHEPDEPDDIAWVNETGTQVVLNVELRIDAGQNPEQIRRGVIAAREALHQPITTNTP